MQKFSTLLLALIACAGTMFADGIKIGDLYYKLHAEDLTAEVTYQEKWSSTNYSDLTTVNIPESVEYNSVTCSVTSIGEDAFFYCSGLTSITIPSSVTSIGRNAFYGCSGLTSITIPNSVTSIGREAFRDCSGLTAVTIPNSVTSIGSYAFYACTGLTSIVVSSGNTKYDSRENCNAIIKTSSNTLIQGCKNTIIPNSVTSIGESAFGGCTGLTSIDIPNSVTSIGYMAFHGCSGLTSINIPNSVRSIGYEAFSWCTGLTSIVVASGNTNYDSRENCNAIIETATNTLIAGCKNTIIPNSVTSIGLGAFDGCTGLTSVTIPNSVTSIGMSAFEYCTGLTSGTNYATTPQTINYNVFYNVDLSSCTLYVPEGSIDLYQAAEVWKDFSNIQAIDKTHSIGEVNQQPTSNPTQKLIRNGNVYILTGDKTYTVTGQQLK